MIRRTNLARYAAILACLFGFWGTSMAQQRATQAETVMVTLHAKLGSETALERVIAQHWKTAHDLKLVLDVPHITMRGMEGGNNAYFIDIFTWRDARIPDTAPPEIQKIWKDMHDLVEARGGHPGLDIAQVSLVAP